MFVNTNNCPSLRVRLVNFSHTRKEDSEKFEIFSQERFIEEKLSPEGRESLFGHPPPFTNEEITAKAEKCRKQTGVVDRLFFNGEIEEMAGIATTKAIEKARIKYGEIDTIIGASNTGPGYPSLADRVKNYLYKHNGSTIKSSAVCFDVQEACTVGSIAIFIGWSMIRSGSAKTVLVVLAEKATELAKTDNWKASNLFSDAAAAVVLSSSLHEQFSFFDMNSYPEEGNLDSIYKHKEELFQQDGPKVHRFVGGQVIEDLDRAVKTADINPKNINHLVTHQPSGKTVSFLQDKISSTWQDYNYKGTFHQDFAGGNTSSVSTLALISKKIESGEIKNGDLIVVCTFGAGLSVGCYGFYYSMY